MKTKYLFFFSLLIFILAKESLALRCSGDIISKGDSKSDVIAQCGEPTFQNHFQREITQRSITAHTRKKYSEIEHWLYDFGSRRLTQLLEFTDDKLVKITTGGYGGRKSDPKFCQGFWKSERIGQLQPQVTMHCGEPDKVRRKEAYTIKIQSTDQYDIFLTVYVDEWTYDVGSRYPLNVLRFENGVLKRIFAKKRED